MSRSLRASAARYDAIMRRLCCVGVLAAGATAFLACGFTGAGESETPVPGPDATTSGSPSDASTANADIPIGDGGISRSAYETAVLSDGPLLYYRLEEPVGAMQAVSEVASFPPATIFDKPMLGVAGKVGHAFAFDGNANAYLEVGDDATQFAGRAPYTLEAWVFPVASDGAYRHVFIRDTNDQNGGRNEYGVWVHDSKFGFERFTDGNGIKAISDAVPLKAWYHVVAVYDGSNVTLWVNGRNVSQQSDTSQTKTKDKPLRFGTRDPNASHFNGTIDEIAVYSHALSSDRITAHFQAAP